MKERDANIGAKSKNMLDTQIDSSFGTSIDSSLEMEEPVSRIWKLGFHLITQI